MIAGIVLAAGASRRLGRPKQLLSLGDRPLLAWALAAMRDFAPDQLVLVLGHAAAEIQAAVPLDGVQVVINARYAEGQSTSLQAGIAALDATVQAAVVITADQPFIDGALLSRLLEVHRATGLPIVAADYGDHLGVPLLLARPSWPLVSRITGDQGARPLLRQHPDLVARLPVSDRWTALDVDTEEAYAAARAVLANPE